MTTEKESEGLTPELAAKGHWNETAPQPAEPPKKEPEPPKEPEQPPPPKEEPPREPEKKEAAEPSPKDDKRSRVKARINELMAKRDATLAVLNLSGEDKTLEAVHKARMEEQEADALAAIEEGAKEYMDNFSKAFPDENHRERLSQYAQKYSPKIIEADPVFAEWWTDHPHHFETMNSLYHYFAEDPGALEKFANNTTFDKKEIIEAVWKNLSSPKPAEPAKPPETPNNTGTPANGTPLPKVEGESPKPSASDEMQAIYDQNRANHVRSIRK